MLYRQKTEWPSAKQQAPNIKERTTATSGVRRTLLKLLLTIKPLSKKGKIQRRKLNMKLQSLRISTGWSVDFNVFNEAEPKLFVEEETDYRCNFIEDMLQLHKGNLILDLGWYPDSCIHGMYRLVLIKNQDWSNPIYILETKEKKTVIEAIETQLLSDNVHV